MKLPKKLPRYVQISLIIGYITYLASCNAINKLRKKQPSASETAQSAENHEQNPNHELHANSQTEEIPVIKTHPTDHSENDNQLAQTYEVSATTIETGLECKKGSLRFVIYDKNEKILKYCQDGIYKNLPSRIEKMTEKTSHANKPTSMEIDNKTNINVFSRGNKSYHCYRGKTADFICKSSK